MKKAFFQKVVADTVRHTQDTLGKKAVEYARNNNPMHNFEVGARITGQTRERVLHGFALKHHISIEDMRQDIEAGKLPTPEMVEEKFGDAINYLILEKASFLDRIS